MTDPRGLREAGKRLGGVKWSAQDNEMAGECLRLAWSTN